MPLVYVAPTTLKKYATGTGLGGKDEVLLAAERALGHLCPVATNDQADALWLAAMGCHQYGHPLCPMPARNSTALSTPDWPHWKG